MRRERLSLSDTITVTLRPLVAGDKELLRRAFEQMSDESRYNRFFAAKARLGEAELRYLTEIDQLDHVAFVAVRTLDGREEAVGVARAIRLPREPDVYEAAVTVVDTCQRCGLGGALVERLLLAARERGSRALRFYVLPSNWAMRALLQRVASEAAVSWDEGVLRFDVPLATDRRLALGS